MHTSLPDFLWKRVAAKFPLISAWAYGRHLFWGALYSLPEFVYFFPKIVGEREGGGGKGGHFV